MNEKHGNERHENEKHGNEEHLNNEIEKKKEQIAEVFMQHFKNEGMRNTIIADVAAEMKISKKTIYKYFAGGKKDALHFFFKRIAIEFAKSIKKMLINKTPEEKLRIFIDFIIKIGTPYVEDNVADEEGFAYETQIVGMAFREEFEVILRNIIDEGIEYGIFHPKLPLDIVMVFMYGILLESFKLIREEPELPLGDYLFTAFSQLLMRQ